MTRMALERYAERHRKPAGEGGVADHDAAADVGALKAAGATSVWTLPPGRATTRAWWARSLATTVPRRVLRGGRGCRRGGDEHSCYERAEQK